MRPRSPYAVATAALVAAVVVVILIPVWAGAQDFSGGPVFRVDSAARKVGGGPAIEGYVYNDGSLRLSNIHLKVEVLGADGNVLEEAQGWVFGNLPPGGRGYFVVALRRAATAHRVSIVSFDPVSGR
jgi:hypothetical protein